MLLVLSIVYVLKVVLAASTPLAFDALTIRQSAATIPDCDCTDLSSQRSALDILWSCLVTIFACVWISVHPNIPSPDDSWLTITLRRCQVTLWALLVPELILAWALKQWLGARAISKFYKDRGWTMTHGHLLQMGGFMLCVDGEPFQALTPNMFRGLHNESKIDWPTISEESIWDKSKGDVLAKGLVVMQTLWFVAQCIARGAQQLTITELELVTLGFAVLTGVTYIFWWNKPLDIRIPYNVHYKGPGYPNLASYPWDVENSIDTRIAPPTYLTEVSRAVDTSSGIPEPAIPAHLVPTQTEDVTPAGTCEIHSAVEHLHNLPGSQAQFRVLNSPQNIYPLPTQADSSTESRDVDITDVVADYSAVEEPNSSNSMLNSTTIAQDSYPTIRTADEKITSSTCSIWRSLVYEPIRSFYASAIEMQIGQRIKGSETDRKRVTTFYSFSEGTGHLPIHIMLRRGVNEQFIYFLIGGIFGGIHCIGWSSLFLSPAEAWIWKSSSIIIVFIPSYFGISAFIRLFLSAFLPRKYGPKQLWWEEPLFSVSMLLRTVMIPGILIYFAARVLLLTEAVIALRNLPQGALRTFQWTKLIPHF